MIGRVWEGGEELAGPPTHAFAISGHDPVVLVALNFDRAERLVRPAPPQLALAGGPQVAHPVGLATARDEVTSVFELERGEGVLIGRPLRRPRTVSVGPPSQRVIGFTTWLMKNREGT
jgi:hypothetical protein